MALAARDFRRDALHIWRAALDAVDSERLVRQHVQLDGTSLTVVGHPLDLSAVRRIAVVGAGKAGAGMAAGLEAALEAALGALPASITRSGWLNVPADCVRETSWIHLHPARPAGVNEPTAEGVRGSTEIIRIVGQLEPHDLCIALVSGGGSALLPLPVDGITLDDKLAVTRHLSAAGAPIDELNTVRKQLSQIKGGGLARVCRAGRLIALIISDVLGDPLDLIASGPTVADTSTPDDAIAILQRYRAAESGISPRIFAALETRRGQMPAPPACQVSNHIIGNNATAVAAAVRAADELGYQVESESAAASEGSAESVAARLVEKLAAMSGQAQPRCFISGGEPTVKLVDAAHRGRGGRNQQVVLAAVTKLAEKKLPPFVLLSGGTDGEDGPTDAAGAWADQELIEKARARGLDPLEHLARNDAYPWFAAVGGLLKTGPTHTNVCDVRVVVSGQQAKDRKVQGAVRR